MKIKGISWIEQNVEKIVLGVVALVFLGVVASQFLIQPNRIKVGKGDPLPPGRAFQPAEERARQIKAAIERSEVPGLPAPASSTMVEDFRKAHQARVTPTQTIARLGAPMNLGIAGESSGAPGSRVGTGPIASTTLPAPAGPVAFAYRSTIDPTETIDNPELAKLLPAEQPFDKAGVSVEAVFDGQALLASLGKDPDGDGPQRPLPQSWWRASTDLLGVVLERQEQKSDGSWGEASEVAGIPGHFNALAAARGAKNAAEMSDAMSQIRAYGSEVMRPSYLRTIAGPEWSPPSEAIKGAGAANPEVERLLSQLRGVNDDLGRLNAALDNLGRQPAGGREPPPGGGGGRGGGGGGRPGGGQEPPANRPDPAAAQKQSLERRIKEAEQRKVDLEDRIVAAGGKVPGRAEDPADKVAEKGKPLFEDAAVRVWAHDLTAQPGKTYRYRVRAAINSPLFGRSASLPDDQKDLAKAPVMVGEPSEWTAPVAVPADRYFYVLAAAPSDGLNPPRATAEVYQFFYGYYRKGTVSLEPGDVVAATGLKLPDANKLPVYDLAKLAQGTGNQPAGQPSQPPAATPPAGRDEIPGGGRPGGRGGRPGGAAPPAAPGAGQGAPARPALPENAQPWAKPINVNFDLFLVDVAPGAGGDPARPKIMFADGEGQLIARSLDDERGNDLLRLLQRSAKDGESQGQPLLAEGGANRPAVPRQGPRQPEPPAGGGGGGGGSN